MRPKNEEIASGREFREFHSASFGLFFRAGKVLHTGESPFQKIEVFENEDFGRVLFLDSLVQTTEKDEFFYHEMLVHPALFSHPAPQKILIIGGGDGGVLREALRYPIEKALLVEIDAEVIKVAGKYFPWLDRALQDPRSELRIGDGNEFIRMTDEKFDVILVDSSDPVGPSTVLHQRSFFSRAKRCLNPGGIIAAQAGSLTYHLDEHRKKSAFLARLFRIFRFYTAPVPTYPGGTWVYVFLSDIIDPLERVAKTPPAGLKFYNPEVHRAAFALPNFFPKH
jgi:spermidine synthase